MASDDMNSQLTVKQIHKENGGEAVKGIPFTLSQGIWYLLCQSLPRWNKMSLPRWNKMSPDHYRPSEWVKHP